MYGRVLKVDLSGDEFDERLYDRDCGEGAAQRAVDSIRDEPQSSGDAAKEADGEKKELTLDEKVKLTEEAIRKILGIMTELPPDVRFTVGVMLKPMLPSMGGMAGMLMMGGPFAPPRFGAFDIRAANPRKRDFPAPPFPHDLSFMGRFG